MPPVLSLRFFVLYSTLTFFALAVAPSAFGQLSNTGLDQFGTFQRNHIQTMNLFNLNNHMEIPLFAKKERGVSYYAKLVWDQSDSLQFVQRPYPPGGQYFQVSGGPGLITVTDVYYNSHVVGGQTCSPNTSAVTTYFDSVVDQNNTVHPIPTGASVTTGQYCGSGTWKTATQDGKWLLTYTWTDQNCWGEGCITSVTETDTSGNVYGGPSGSTTALTDPNGNQITKSTPTPPNSTWTDSTGNTVFTSQEPSPPPYIFSYPVQGGGMANVQVNFTSGFTLQNNFGCNLPYTSTSTGLPTSISLPGGTSYSFVYESTNGAYPSTTITGRIHSITVPAGGTWTYTYSGGTNGINCTGTPGSPATITITGSDSSVWTYNRTIVANCPGGICQPGPWSQTVVTDPACNDTVYEFAATGVQMQVQSYQGTAGTPSCPASTKTLMQTVTTCYNNNFSNCGTAPGSGNCPAGQSICRVDKYTYLPGLAQPSLSETFYNASELPTQQNEFDFGVNTGAAPTTTPLRATKTRYANIGNNILNRPACVQVNGGTSPSTCGTVTSTTKAITNYLNYDSHGNVGTIQELVSGSSTYISRTLTYYSTGLVNTENDFKGTPTTYTYGNCNNSYPTQITKAGLSQYLTWDCNGGVVTSTKNANGQTTSHSYTNPSNGVADPFWRLTQTNYPDGGKFTTTYNDTASPVNVSTSQLIDNSGRSVTTQTNFDSFGRPVRSVLTSDPDCPSGDKTDTTYDALGHVHTVSNPYCTTSDSTYGLTTYAYDALGRTTQITHPDNSTILTTYTGRATQVQDEGNGTQRVTRISQTDGLGRLASVCEVTSTSLIGSGGTPSACGQDIAATGFLTTYQYDALDNLLQVTQAGINSRSFSYDSLSRLTKATNPESGVICYGTISGGVCQSNGYDANGNLVKKTDARNITITYAYDALNRLTGKTYSDGTPAATFNYDQTSALGVTLTNTIGRKSSESTASPSPTGSVFSYNQMGRVVDNSQCTPQNCGTSVFGFQYTQYDFLGDLLSATNAVGVTFNYSYNGVARLTTITTNFVDPSHPGTLFSSATYNPPGLLNSARLGNNLTETRNYNPRLWLTSLAVGSAYSLNMTSYAPNGNVLAANDSVNTNWSYLYDPFNRLFTANASGQSYSYDYDRFGNRWHQNGPHSSQLGFDANNHISGVTGVGYDPSGDLTSDGSGTGSHRYFYDAENRIIQVDGTLGTCSTATACYVYDAEGRRVRKTTASGSLDFLYDANGHKVAEVDTTGVFQRGELYAGGRHFAVYAPEPGPTGATFFTHGDWLGTERARTDMTGAACETITSLPFGDAQTISGNCGNSSGDVSPMHFTGKERDPESNLDNFGARYDSSNLGRFMTPDPSSVSGDIVESEFPQSWNMYSYVLNNPLNAVDPDGLDYYLLGGDRCGQDIQCDKQGFVLGSDGNRQVVTDQQINGSNGLAKIDENGNLQINTAQGTFQGQFFDPNIGANGAAIIPQAIVTISSEERALMTLQDAGAMATPGVNAAMAITAPQLIFMGGATIALSGGGSTLTLEAGAEVTATPGEVASISRAAAQGGRRAVQRALRSYQKRLAEHLAKLNEIKGDPGSVQREINNFRGLIKAAEEYLSKNP